MSLVLCGRTVGGASPGLAAKERARAPSNFESGGALLIRSVYGPVPDHDFRHSLPVASRQPPAAEDAESKRSKSTSLLAAAHNKNGAGEKSFRLRVVTECLSVGVRVPSSTSNGNCAGWAPLMTLSQTAEIPKMGTVSDLCPTAESPKMGTVSDLCPAAESPKMGIVSDLRGRTQIKLN